MAEFGSLRSRLLGEPTTYYDDKLDEYFEVLSATVPEGCQSCSYPSSAIESVANRVISELVTTRPLGIRWKTVNPFAERIVLTEAVRELEGLLQGCTGLGSVGADEAQRALERQMEWHVGGADDFVRMVDAARVNPRDAQYRFEATVCPTQRYIGDIPHTNDGFSET